MLNKHIFIYIILHYIKVITARIDAAKPSSDTISIQQQLFSSTMAWRCMNGQ